MSSSKQTVIAFDLYGTLLSTESIAKQLAEHFGLEKADALAQTWRKYQLEYTWRLNSMGQYLSFSTVTLRSLRHTLAEAHLSLPDPAIDALMEAYDSLSTFPDVAPALTAIAGNPSVSAVVFSNGTRSMVSNSVHKSPSLSPHANVFKDLIVVEDTRRFKPDPLVYRMLARAVGKEDSIGEVWLVSGNPFDVVGARAVGMQAAWVDRAGSGWMDALVEGQEGGPTAVVRGLGEVVDAVLKFAASG